MTHKKLWFVGIGISFEWRLWQWFDAGPKDDFDKMLMVGPLQLMFDEIPR